MAGKETIAFWLRPAEPERKFLAELIKDLARRFEAPAFEPHLTLQGGEMTLAQARTVLRAIPAPATLRLEVCEITFSDAYTKTVFIQFRPNVKAGNLSAAFAAAPGASRSYKFDPHLSLIYKEMSQSEKEDLAQTIEIPFQRVTFDSLKLIACPAEIKQRRDVEVWRTLGRRSLANFSG